MTKAARVIALAWIGCNAGAAHAESFLNAFAPPSARFSAPSNGPLVPGCGCADLNGAWTGTCSVDGKEQAAVTTLAVVQTSCERITINGEQIPIGGQRTSTLTLAPVLCEAQPRALSNRALTDASESSADWNTDKTGLLLTARSNTRNISGDAASLQMASTLRLEAAHLLLDVAGQTGANTTFTVSCSFEK